MYIYTIRKIGNSLGIILPKDFMKGTRLKMGKKVAVEANPVYQIIVIKPLNQTHTAFYLTPDYFKWFKDVNRALKLLNKVKERT